MRIWKCCAASAAAAAALFCAAACAAPPDYAEGEALVLLKGAARAGTSKAAALANAASAARKAGASAAAVYESLSAGSGNTVALIRSGAKTADELIGELGRDPNVIGVSRNYIRRVMKEPDDPGWNGEPQDQWGPKRINAPYVWDKGVVGSDGVYVAVLDTGVVYDHEDLKDNMCEPVYGRMFYGGGKSAGIERAGTPDGLIGLEDVDMKNIGDISGHGTHVAGVIGAVGDNGRGVAGVNWKVRIIPVGVFTMMDEGYSGAYDSDVIAGLDYIVGLKRQGVNIRVANLSLGRWGEPVDQDTDPYAQAYKRASDAGILIFVSAMNDNQDLNAPRPVPAEGIGAGCRCCPASFQFENMLTVGAVGDWESPVHAGDPAEADARASYSNYSSKRDLVHIFAPGSRIMSTVPQFAVNGAEFNWDKTGYAAMDGTSMASPMAAGAAALLCAAYPDETPQQIKARLTDTADRSVPPEGGSKYGMIDLKAAYDMFMPKVYAVSRDIVINKVNGGGVEVISAAAQEDLTAVAPADVSPIPGYGALTSVTALAEYVITAGALSAASGDAVTIRMNGCLLSAEASAPGLKALMKKHGAAKYDAFAVSYDSAAKALSFTVPDAAEYFSSARVIFAAVAGTPPAGGSGGCNAGFAALALLAAVPAALCLGKKK